MIFPGPPTRIEKATFGLLLSQSLGHDPPLRGESNADPHRAGRGHPHNTPNESRSMTHTLNNSDTRTLEALDYTPGCYGEGCAEPATVFVILGHAAPASEGCPNGGHSYCQSHYEILRSLVADWLTRAQSSPDARCSVCLQKPIGTLEHNLKVMPL